VWSPGLWTVSSGATYHAEVGSGERRWVGRKASEESERGWRDALVIGSLLAPEGAAAYATAMRWWAWGAGAGGPAGEAGPDVVTFMTPKRKQAMRAELLGVRFELVFIKPERMFGVELLGEPGLRIRVTDRERTVVDMLDRGDLCGGVPAAALRQAWPALDLEQLDAHLERFAGGTVPRRLGYLAERMGLLPQADPRLAHWRGLIGAGYSLLERGGPAEGPFVRRWGLRVNVPELV
jgi:predicted transcriptional regulator of viral defense system